MTRLFPAPWSVREFEQAFVVSDANGQAVAYTYFRRDENEAQQARVLTWTRPAGSQPISPSCPSCCHARAKNELDGRPPGRRADARPNWKEMSACN